MSRTRPSGPRIAPPPPLPGFSQPARPLPLAGLLCGWAGLLNFAAVDGWRPLSWIIVLLAALATALRGRWLASLPYALVGAAAVLGCIGLFGDAWFEGSDFTASLVFRIALGLAALQCLAFLRIYAAQQELGAYSLSVSLLMASTFTYENHLVSIVFCVTLQIVSLALAMRQRVKGSGFSGAACVALALALLVGGGSAALLRLSERRLSRFLGMFMMTSGASFSFPGASQLDTLLRNEKNPMVILRYRSTLPPRYLVGNCYVSFAGKTWKTKGQREELPGQDLGDGLFGYTLGRAPQGDSSGATIDDSVEMGGRGLSLFLPRDCATLTVNSPTLGRRYADNFEASNKGSYAGLYSFTRTTQRLVSPWENVQDDRAVYLQIPPDLTPTVARLALQETRGALSDRQKAQRLETFLQEHYTYGFDYPFSESRDPIADFLEKKPPAHCELFASSLTLMLRTLGIPARYVNGFIVRERSVAGGYYVVRARDGHAWVEAYVDGAWILLDPTPPAALQEQMRSDWFESVGEWLAYHWSQLGKVDLEKLAWQAVAQVRAYGGYLVGLALLGWLLTHPPSWTAVFKWKARAPAPVALTLEDLPLLLRRFEAVLGWQRPPGTTLTRWALELDDSGKGLLARQFLANYVRLRYATPAPQPGDVEALELQLRQMEALLAAEKGQG